MPGRVDTESSRGRDLVERIRRGDSSAFEAFFARNERWVRGIVFSVLGPGDLVDDVAQEVWISLWQRLPGLEEPSRWRSWLCRLARNAAIDALRRRRSRLGALERFRARWRPPRRDGSEGPSGRLEESEVHQRVLRAILALPEIYREPFVLRHLQEWDYAMIAEALEVPVATVETRLVRARRRLRKTLREVVMP